MMPVEWMAPLTAFLVCWISLVWLLRSGRLPMDHPNERSLHVTPTPHIGGLGIMAGIGVAAVWLAASGLLQPVLPVVLAAFVLAVVSVLNDVRGLPVALRYMAGVRAPRFPTLFGPGADRCGRGLLLIFLVIDTRWRRFTGKA